MIQRLTNFLRPYTAKGVALAYSGGVDSALLLHVLLRMQKEVDFPLAAYFFHTPLHTEEEVREAKRTAKEAGIHLITMRFNPLELPALRFNPTDRCYHCKRCLFSRLQEDARARGLGIAMDGTHADDHRQYRPGLKALRELGVISPLAAVGMSKADVRHLAAQWGLSCSSKPSAPCLATRFDYGTELTEASVRLVEKGEELLHGLFPGQAVRLRVHGNKQQLARIEVPRPSLPHALRVAEQLVQGLRALGFHYVSLDLQGFRSGSMDELITSAPHPHA